MSRFLSLCVLVIAACQLSLQKPSKSSEGHKICVPENSKEACSLMMSEGAKQGVQLTCVIGRDRFDCLEKIGEHNADFTFAEPEDMYVAAVLDNQKYTVLKEIRNKDQSEAEFRYKGVAIIRNEYNLKGISSLKGAKSCHTGIGRTVGYRVPLIKLNKMKVLGPLSDTSLSARENELKALSTFFSKACIVGKWSQNDIDNASLKRRYRNLCALCENPSKCDYPDENSGYRGALKCLHEAGGDIAWTKTQFVDEYFGLKGTKMNSPENYSYLCPDGKKVPLSESPCTWAARPWSGYIADANLTDTESLRNELSRLNKLGEAVGSEWFTMILRLDNKSVTVDNANKLHPYEYLTKAKYYDILDRNIVVPRRSIRWCVTTEAAHKKCVSLKLAAFSRGVRPEFDCVLEKSEQKCFKTIRDGGADIITADALDAYLFSGKYNINAAMAEFYYGNTSDLYAVAVVKKSSAFQSLKDLQGKKSCHAPDMKMAAWIAPLAALMQSKLINEGNCDSTESLAKFFSGGSCLPQTPENSAEYSQLVSLCGKKTKEGYEEYEGALECLLSQGDVAFVPHITLIKYIQENRTSENDVQLLCPDGSRAAYNQYEQCNLGKVPPRVVVVSNQKSSIELDDLMNALKAISDLYGAQSDLFKLFPGLYKRNNNVLFSNTAIGFTRIAGDSAAYFGTISDMYKPVREHCPLKIEESWSLGDSDKFFPQKR